MVEHIREGHDQYGPARSEEIVGAVLCRSTRPAEVDTWRLSSDLAELLGKDGRSVIYGTNESDIESEIWKRHPAEGAGVSLVTKGYNDWEIERVPRLLQPDLALLQEACALHQRVLVGNDLVNTLGGRERLVSLGFLLSERRSRWCQLVRYNPRQVLINQWRAQANEVDQYLQGEFPPPLVQELFKAVIPDQWRNHPYEDLLRPHEGLRVTEEPRHARRGRRRCPPANLPRAPETILGFIDVAKRLTRPERPRPWRRVDGWRELLEQLVQYVHGVAAGEDDQWRRLARWVRREARFAKVKIPPKQKLPPRPRFGKQRRGRRRRTARAPRPALQETCP